MTNRDYFEASFDRNLEAFIKEFEVFLSFKSISTDPAYTAESYKCIDWLSQKFSNLGFKTESIQTPTKPIFYAEYFLNKDAKTVLYYGHYDVQPVDPLELWESDPFTAKLKDGRIYARGAQDNKGQTFYVIKAIEELLKNKSLKCNLKIIIEGEEECGSVGIGKVLHSLRDKIKADTLLVCDSGTVSLDYPAITMGCRGISFLEFSLAGADHDLHSGTHGGLAPNPAIGICKLLAEIHDENGKIAIPGFYDDLILPSKDELELATKVPFSEEWYKSNTGILPVGGIKGQSWIERSGFYPTVEVNGVFSGYTGVGGKTVLPAMATAKISIRLGTGQDPERAVNLLNDFLISRKDPAFEYKLISKRGEATALRVDPDMNEVKKATEILKQIAVKEVIHVWFGGSIPIVGELAKVAGADPLLVGFGLDEDRIHSPNESFSIRQLKLGYVFASLYLS